MIESPGDYRAQVAPRDGGPDGIAEDPAARLRRLIAARQTESIEILRNWMEHDEERA